MMYDALVAAQANGVRTYLAIAQILGIPPRYVRKSVRRQGLTNVPG